MASRGLKYSGLALLHLAVMSATTVLAQGSSAQSTRHELADGLTWGGSLRGRYENKSNFQFGGEAPVNSENFFLSQIRLNFLWQASDEVAFFIEGQDAGIQNENDINEDATPNIFADDFDLHQGHLTWKGEGWKTIIGRQKLKYGTERLVGPLEWVNTARVFDAAVVSAGDPATSAVDFIASRAVPVDPNDFNDWSSTGNRYANSSLYGAYYTNKEVLSGGALEGYYLFRHEDDVDDKVHTVGTRLDGKSGALDFNGEFAYQFGDYGGLDHSAWAGHAEAGWTVDAENAARLGVAYNYASGDDDPDDGDHETFDNLYPTNHLYYGYMDFFAWQNMQEVELSFKITPVEKLVLRVAYHTFWLVEEDTDAWYNAGLGTVRNAGGSDVDSSVGSELDFTVAYPVIDKKLDLLVGYSHFFTSDYVDDTGEDEDADYGYLQAKFNLG